MLRFAAFDTEGNETELPSPTYVTINMDENVPADDMTLIFASTANIKELSEIVVRDGDEVVFRGVVDEQRFSFSNGLSVVRISARSMAALLLDNEAKPVDYYCPSVSVIFERHIRPCGIEGFIGEDRVLREHLNIPKGTSCYRAVCDFALPLFGKAPRINPDGLVDFNGIENNKTLYFSNVDGISFNSYTENKKRCRLLSDVYVKLSDYEGYVYDVADSFSEKKGVRRVRYLDASGTTSALIADRMLSQSRGKYYELTLDCSSRLLGSLGASAIINDSALGRIERIYVSGLCYSLTPEGENTMLKLRRINDVDI